MIESNKNSSMPYFDTKRDEEDFMRYANNFQNERVGVKTSSNNL